MKKIFRITAIILILTLCAAYIPPMGNAEVLASSTQQSKGAASKKKKISLNKKKATIRAHQTIMLKLKNAKKKKVKWSSSNKKVATVSKKGKVRALKKGKVTITAKYKGKKYKCKIKVKKAVKSVNGSTLLQSEYLLDKLYNKKNIIISAASLNMALGMVANGAVSNAKKDLEKYLGKPLDEYNQYSLKLMNRAAKDSMLTLANGVWYRDDYNIKPFFNDAVKKYYNAEVKKAPLDNSTVQEINQWASNNTEGMIQEIIKEIPEETAVVLTNALLFKGEWTVPFEANYTRKENFTKFDGKKVKVDMMHTDEYAYYENDYAVGFEKTYGKKEKYSFIAILPKIEGEFKLSNLELESFLKSKTGKYKVNISMPKFTYDWEDNGALTAVLKTSGIQSIFDWTANPLGNMLQTSESVYATDISQACKIIVDEKGTKAAAVTSVSCKATSYIPEPSKTVSLDRPFGYIIMDNTTKDVLFMGKVVTP
ncbi:MAG: serpin family protein [Eubacterium sp.]